MPPHVTNTDIKNEPSLPDHLAAMFMDAAAQGPPPPLDLISLLTKMALGADLDLAKEATQSLYNKIILPLCDDFTSSSVEVANKVLINMILAFCRTSYGKETQQILHDLQLTDQQSFLSRYRDLAEPRTLSVEERKKVKKIFILSRITLGADIAITSLIISHCKEALPEADIYLIGPDHLRHLFYDEQLHHLHFSYDRDGTLLEKMTAWPRLFKIIAKESKHLAGHEILIFDPDTRLSQLGLLPLTSTSSTYYLCSRQDQEKNASLPEITCAWLQKIFPGNNSSFPQCLINPDLLAQCRSLLSKCGSKTLRIFINLGVGNDEKKRLSDPFEEELLASLLQTRDTLIILDSGKGALEEKMAKRLMAKMAKKGYNTAQFSEEQLARTEISFLHGMVRFTGKIDSVAGLVSNCDLFIGYDSCGQHLATSTETPSIICFIGAPNKRFLGRWQPSNHHGKTTTLIVDQNPLSGQKRSELIDKIVITAARYRS
ncbi:MAG: hypothetical protein ABFS09_07390 [Thermodesulfobacteriota bacterium]